MKAPKAIKHILIQLPSASYQQLLGTARFAKNRHWSLTFIEHDPPDSVRFDGMISTIPVASRKTIDFIRKLVSLGIPVVDSSFQRPDIRIPRITGDYEQIGILSAQHFRERYFRHVAFFSRDWDIMHRLRYSAFERHWQGPAPILLRPPFDRQLALAEKPLGVLAYNDIDAAFFINHCLDSGYRIPEDIAVLGIDNNEIICENQQIPISSIVHDLEQISYERAALLDRLMNGEAQPSSPILIKPRGIVTRTSTETIACSNPLVTKALSWINEHLAESFGSEQLAQAIHINRVKLDRLFSDSLQVSVAKTVLRKRIEKAKQLLADPSLKLEYIAAKTGFCHAAHLSNAFRRMTGLTPRKWAKTGISN